MSFDEQEPLGWVDWVVFALVVLLLAEASAGGFLIVVWLTHLIF